MLAIVCVLISIVSIQSGASLAKQLFPMVGPQGTTSLRLLFAALILLCVWRPWRRPAPTRAGWKLILIYGLSLGLMNLLFYMSLAYIPLGIAVAVEFTGPLCVAVLGSKHRRDLIWVACAATGIALLLPLQSSVAALNPLGLGLALAAGACWATYIVYGQKASSTMHGGTVATLGMCAAAVVAAPVGMMISGPALFAPAILPLALGVAVFSSALPYSLEMVALRRLPAHTFSILMSLEPAAAALAGFLFLHETLSTRQLVAIFLVMIASLGSSWSSARQAKLVQL